MSTGMIAPRGIDPTVPPIPFWRETAVEFRKLVGTRGPRVLLILLGIVWLCVLAGLVFTSIPIDFADGISIFGSLTRIFLGILTILLVTGEWGQRSVLSTFTLEPRRERVIAAKLCAVLALGAVTFAASLLLTLLVTSVRGGSFVLAAEAIRFGGLKGLFDILMAFAIALAILNTAGAIVAYLALPEVIVPLLLLIVSLAVKSDSSRDGFVDRLTEWITPAAAFRDFQTGAVDAQSWAHVLVAATVWIGVPALIGTYRVMTSEVK